MDFSDIMGAFGALGGDTPYTMGGNQQGGPPMPPPGPPPDLSAPNPATGQPPIVGDFGGAPPMAPPSAPPPGPMQGPQQPPAGIPGSPFQGPAVPTDAPMPQPRPNPGQDLGAPPAAAPMPQPRPPGAPMPPPQPPQPAPDALPPSAAPRSGPAPAPPSGPPGGGFAPQFNTSIEPMRRPPQQGGLLSALGINLSPERRASIGAGLVAAGQNANKPAGAALAGSMGAAMQGGEKKGEHEDAEQMKRNQQQFAQTSTAYNDLLKANAAGNAIEINAARARYFDARAKQIEAGGGGTNAWQNTPFGRSIAIRRQVEQAATEREKTLREQWKLNSTPKDEQDRQLAQLDQWKQQEMEARGKPFGLSGAQVNAISSMGTEPPKIKGADGKDIPNPKFNPFDVRSMSEEQFKEMVPIGGYYRDTDGKIYKRTQKDAPKEGSKPKAEEAPKKQSALQQHDDDEEALAES